MSAEDFFLFFQFCLHEKWNSNKNFGWHLLFRIKFLVINLKIVMSKGPFKYYVIKEVGGWGQNMAILDDLHCKSSKSWVGGHKKVKNMMTYYLNGPQWFYW